MGAGGTTGAAHRHRSCCTFVDQMLIEGMVGPCARFVRTLEKPPPPHPPQPPEGTLGVCRPAAGLTEGPFHNTSHSGWYWDHTSRKEGSPSYGRAGLAACKAPPRGETHQCGLSSPACHSMPGRLGHPIRGHPGPSPHRPPSQPPP